LIKNKDGEILPGSLLDIAVNYSRGEALSIPDTSVMLEGSKTYVYKVSADNITNKTEVIIGLRSKGNLQVLSGLEEGDTIVAEGLKKVRPRGKIKPINK
jgi:membrane fusion protein (multidrug efflux system)